ncbi:MAG: hypothetical protein CMH54_07465 [Myxococcales bacterium]|nr:hypothetical protein [Myxococcales bacterium]
MVRLPKHTFDTKTRGRCRWDNPNVSNTLAFQTTAPDIQVVDTVILYERSAKESSSQDRMRRLHKFLLIASASGLLVLGIVLLHILL